MRTLWLDFVSQIYEVIKRYKSNNSYVEIHTCSPILCSTITSDLDNNSSRLIYFDRSNDSSTLFLSLLFVE